MCAKTRACVRVCIRARACIRATPYIILFALALVRALTRRTCPGVRKAERNVVGRGTRLGIEKIPESTARSIARSDSIEQGGIAVKKIVHLKIHEHKHR